MSHQAFSNSVIEAAATEAQAAYEAAFGLRDKLVSMIRGANSSELERIEKLLSNHEQTPLAAARGHQTNERLPPPPPSGHESVAQRHRFGCSLGYIPVKRVDDILSGTDAAVFRSDVEITCRSLLGNISQGNKGPVNGLLSQFSNRWGLPYYHTGGPVFVGLTADQWSGLSALGTQPLSARLHAEVFGLYAQRNPGDGQWHSYLFSVFSFGELASYVLGSVAVGAPPQESSTLSAGAKAPEHSVSHA